MDDLPRFGWDEDPDAEAKPWSDWPRCPRCGTRRETACPDCAVPGDDFALAELDPAADLPMPPEGAMAAGSGGAAHGCCGAHGQGCGAGPLRGGAAGGTAAADDDPGPPPGGAGPDVLLVCPICDEAFPPRFFRRCRKCGHDFGSGPELDAGEESTANTRIIITLLAVLAIMAGIGFYLLSLFGE